MENDAFTMFAPNQESLDEAKEIVDKLMAEKSEPQLEFGAIYKAKVVEIREIGVMITLYPSMQPALIHNSQLDQRKVNLINFCFIKYFIVLLVKLNYWSEALLLNDWVSFG